MSSHVIPVSLAAQPAMTRAAAEALYLAYREPVFRYLRAMTGDEDAALDLTALTFERALRELGRRPADLGMGWLIRTARNAAIDATRHRRSIDHAEERLAGQAAASPSAEETALDAERARRVLAAVASLPLPQREAIALRYSTDLTVRQIAELIDKREAATQKLIGRGLGRLKEMLDDLD